MRTFILCFPPTSQKSFFFSEKNPTALITIFPPAGWLYDYTQTYVCSFLFAGACGLISPISFFFEPSAQKWKLKKANLNNSPRLG